MKTVKNLITKFAVNQYKLHDFLREYQALIVVIIIAKVATMFVSMFAGLNHLRNLFFELTGRETLSVTLAVLSLIIIELLTSIVLAKFFKFAYRAKMLTAGFIALFGFGLFAISFQISSQGIAKYRTVQVDNQPVITQAYEVEKQNINAKFDGEVSYVKEQIASIKKNPQLWKNNRRIILSAEQLADIKLFYSKIEKLNADRNNEMTKLETAYTARTAENKLHSDSEASKYYNIVAVIMIAQFIFSAILMFFWSRIYGDAKPTEIIEERVDIIRTQAENAVERVFNSTFSTMISRYDAGIMDAMTKHKDPKTQSVPDKKITRFSPQKGTHENEGTQRYATQHAKSVDGFTVSGTIPDGTIAEGKTETVFIKLGHRKCDNCGTEYLQKKADHRFCKPTCKASWHKKNSGFEIKKK